MRRVISLLVIARLIQRLINGGRRGPGMGSWNQGARPEPRRRDPNATSAEPPQGGGPGSAQGTDQSIPSGSETKNSGR